MESNITIIIAIVGAIASMCVPAITKWFEHKNLLKKEIRDKKIPVYEKIVELFLLTLVSEVKGGKFEDKEEKMADITKGLICFASSDVIKTWNFWRNNSECKDTSTTLTNMENIFVCIRKDLNYKDNFKKFELLHLFINKRALEYISKS